MTWDQLTADISKRVYRIEMAEGMIAASDADARWERLEAKRLADMANGAHQSDEHDKILRYVSSALIAMKEMKLIDYD